MSTNPTPESSLDKAIEDVLARLEDHDPDSEEYAKANAQLVKLHKLKMEEARLNSEKETHNDQHKLAEAAHELAVEQANRPQKVSKDTLVLAAANILGIVMIVGHERTNIITTKAMDLLRKVR